MGKSVIFDTNAYRDFTYGKSLEDTLLQIEILRLKEKALGYTSLLSPYILIELSAHLCNTNDPSYTNCKAAFIASYKHCKLHDSDNYNMIADAESHLAKILFDYINHSILDKWRNLAGLAYKMSLDNSEISIDKYRSNFCDLSAFSEKVEKQFVDDMFKFVVQELNPIAKDWNPLKEDKRTKKLILNELKTIKPIKYFALAQVSKASEIAGVNLESYDLIDLVDHVIKTFPAPLYLYRNIFKKIIETGADLTNHKKKRWNWIWDIHILFGISNYTLGSKQTLLVTTDDDVIQAAKDAKLSSMVVTLKDYLNEIGYN